MAMIADMCLCAGKNSFVDEIVERVMRCEGHAWVWIAERYVRDMSPWPVINLGEHRMCVIHVLTRVRETVQKTNIFTVPSMLKQPFADDVLKAGGGSEYPTISLRKWMN